MEITKEAISAISEKLATADKVLKQATEYIAVVQPQLDEYNEFKQKIIKHAHQLVEHLVDKGIILKHKSNELIDKIAEDPTVAFVVAKKVSELASPVGLGKYSNLQIADESKMDPFTRLVLTGDSRGKIINNGMID